MAGELLLLAMVVLAIITIHTSKLRRAVVYMGVFSLVSSFAYLSYSAPDVAIAEAVIGSTVATVLYLIALKKYQVLTVYLTHAHRHEADESMTGQMREKIISDIKEFFVDQELEPQIVYTPDNYIKVLEREDHDLLIHHDKERLLIYGNRQNYQLDNLAAFLYSRRYKNLTFEIIRYDEGV